MAASSSSSSFNEGNLEKRLLNVNNTQDCIQTLSLWCVHHKAHFKRIIEIWFKVLKKVKISHRLALFYLANDVIQNSKRKGCAQYVEAWKPMIKRAAHLVRDEDVKGQIERIFIIWESRSVYDSAFIKELQTAIGGGVGGGGGGGGGSGGHAKTGPTAVETKILTEFKPQKLVDRIRKFKKVEAEADAKQKQFISLKIDVCSTETLKTLKDKSHGQKFTHDFEEATIKLEEYVDSLHRDVKERTALLEMLNQSDVYYETQKKEVKIVGNAYKNFGSRVKNLKSKLEEFLPNLPSPIPSPSIDAPSPVDSSVEGSPNKNENKDNTEAVDMEMSDDENENTGKDNSKLDVPSPGSAPSPEGSPVGLSLSPKAREKHSSHSSTSNNKSPSKKDRKPAGPTVASILAQISKSTPKSASTTAKSSASSLDIRLSNLMQNIPNFTSNLFGGRPNFNNSGEVGGGTPVKDEESGRGSVTPLLDESREQLKDPPGGGGTPTLGDILQKLVSTGSTLNLTPQSNTPNWNSPQAQSQQQQQQQQQQPHQSHWFNQNQLPSSSSRLSNVRQLSVPDFNRQNASAMFMDSNFEPNQLSSVGGSQFHSSLNGDRNEQNSVERQGRPNSIGYRRNSNIVELTPSPTRSQSFEGGTEPLTGSNRVPLGRTLNENVMHRNDDGIVSLEHTFPLSQQRHRPGLVQAPAFPRRPLLGRGNDSEVDPEFGQEPGIPSLMEGTTINSNLRMIVPVGSFPNDDKEMPREHPRSFSKIETVGGARESLLEPSVNALEQWDTPSPSGGQQGEQQLYQQLNPQGWHSLNSPPPRREAPPYVGAYRGFRFPRRVPTPRRLVREWNPLGTTTKRPLLSPLRPRWAHNAGPPY